MKTTWMRVVVGIALVAGAARADVESFIQGPPKVAAPDDSALGLMRSDLKMERNAWIDMLREVRGATISTFKQQTAGSCMSDVERKLKIEGYELVEFAQMNVFLTEHGSKDELIRQVVDSLQGYIDRKVAVRVMQSLIITCAPKPGLKTEQRKRGLMDFLQGLTDGELGDVHAYIMREFDPPVGWVCVDMTLGSKASIDSVIRLIELSFGSQINNQSRAMDEDFEKSFGATARQLMENMPPEHRYLWGK